MASTRESSAAGLTTESSESLKGRIPKLLPASVADSLLVKLCYVNESYAGNKTVAGEDTSSCTSQNNERRRSGVHTDDDRPWLTRQMSKNDRRVEGISGAGTQRQVVVWLNSLEVWHHFLSDETHRLFRVVGVQSREMHSE